MSTTTRALIENGAPPTATPETIDRLLDRQSRERQAALQHLLDEQRTIARSARQAIRQDAYTELDKLIAALETQIRQDQKAGRLDVAVSPQIPGLVRQLPQIPDEDEPDRIPAIVFVSPVDASSGHRERRAWALFDCSAQVWR